MCYRYCKYCFLILTFLFTHLADIHAQKNDSLVISDKAKNIKSTTSDSVKIKLHSPKKAAWMSAALPGLGQIYNKKYWKLPIIYVGFGVIGYLGYDFYSKFSKYKSSYMYRMGYDLSRKDYFPEIESTDLLYQNLSYYRRNFELTCIIGSLFYVLNIIDASVDAHLYKFDITEDLSMKIEPEVIHYSFLRNSAANGIKLTLNF